MKGMPISPSYRLKEKQRALVAWNSVRKMKEKGSDYDHDSEFRRMGGYGGIVVRLEKK